MHALDSVAGNPTTKEYRVPESPRERALPANSTSTAKSIHMPTASPSFPAPALWRASEGFFQGWYRSQSIPSSPPNHGSAAKPEKRTLADYGVTSGAPVRRPTVRPVAGDGRSEQAKRRKPCHQREMPLRAVNPIPRSQCNGSFGADCGRPRRGPQRTLSTP